METLGNKRETFCTRDISTILTCHSRISSVYGLIGDPKELITYYRYQNNNKLPKLYLHTSQPLGQLIGPWGLDAAVKQNNKGKIGDSLSKADVWIGSSYGGKAPQISLRAKSPLVTLRHVHCHIFNNSLWMVKEIAKFLIICFFSSKGLDQAIEFSRNQMKEGDAFAVRRPLSVHLKICNLS